MTPLQKGQFSKYIIRKWGEVVKKDIKKTQNEPKNVKNVMEVGGKLVQFQKTE